MTIQIDDAGYGDLLFGVVIGAYKPDTDYFTYDVVNVRFFKEPMFEKKIYLDEAGRIALRLVERLKPEDGESIEVCRGDILDRAAGTLKEVYGDERVIRVKVEGRAQHLVEEAYLDEIRNLGYEPIQDRTEKWAKSFWHMYRWLRTNPEMLSYAKTGWPRLKRFKLFR
ncbi:MAG: hypothetical protein ACETVY_02530 [Candidatus Bathyarchaeia archaeon]